VSVTKKAPEVQGPEALGVSAAEKVPVVPGQDGWSDPGVTQLQALSGNDNGRMFEGNRRKSKSATKTRNSAGMSPGSGVVLAGDEFFPGTAAAIWLRRKVLGKTLQLVWRRFPPAAPTSGPKP